MDEERRLRSFFLFVIGGERMGGLFLRHKYPPLIPVPIRDKGVTWASEMNNANSSHQAHLCQDLTRFGKRRD